MKLVPNDGKKTLLEQALAIPGQKGHVQFTDEELEVAVAWMMGRIGHNAAAAVLKSTKNNIVSKLTWMLKRAAENGRIEVKVVEKP